MLNSTKTNLPLLLGLKMGAACVLSDAIKVACQAFQFAKSKSIWFL